MSASARMPATTVEGHRGDGSLRNSSSAAIRPAQIISMRSQGTQCVGSPRRPSIRKSVVQAGCRWTVRAGLNSGNWSARQASAATSAS